MIPFFASVIITALMCGVVALVGSRRAPGTPLTWGEAFLAATFVFALLLMLYGVVPNQWLLWADNELGWRSDKFLFPNGISFFGRGRILISYETIRDVIASGFYAVFLVGQVLAWRWWQSRGKRAAAPPAIETSAYGRPLVRRA